MDCLVTNSIQPLNLLLLKEDIMASQLHKGAYYYNRFGRGYLLTLQIESIDDILYDEITMKVISSIGGGPNALRCGDTVLARIKYFDDGYTSDRNETEYMSNPL